MLTTLGILLTIVGGMTLVAGSYLWGAGMIALSWYFMARADRADEARFFGWIFLFALIAIALGGVLTE